MKTLFCAMLLCAYLGAFAQTSPCPLGMKFSDNLVKNGNFSDGYSSFESDYGKAGQAGLFPEGLYAVTTEIGALHNGWNTCGDHTSGSGKMMIVNGSVTENNVIWRQQLKIQPYTLYNFSLFVQNLAGSNMHLFARVNGQKVDLGSDYAYSCGWSEHKVQWFSNVDTAVIIEILDEYTDAGGNDFILDDIQFCGCEPIVPIKKETKPIVQNEFDSLKTNETIVLQNVHFQQSKYDLDSLCTQELDKVADWLKTHPNVQIELDGHTSNEGDAAKNLTLSENRVQACKNYLVKQNVDNQRIKAVALGENQPAYPNDTPENRKKNRRVELKLLKS